jgi:hypothetical protein
MSVEPGKTWPEMSRIAFPLDDLSILPPQLLLVALAGEDDDVVGDIDARKVYTTATNVLPENKNYVRMFSDDRGTPALRADHRMPSAPGGMVESTGESPLGPAELSPGTFCTFRRELSPHGRSA